MDNLYEVPCNNLISSHFCVRQLTVLDSMVTTGRLENPMWHFDAWAVAARMCCDKGGRNIALSL